jgi:outer membrane receptor protein involved in Fe transport
MFASGNIITIQSPSFATGNLVDRFKLNLISNENLKPEYSQNYETGFKLLKENLFENESQSVINFTYFIQDVKNFIIQDPSCTAATCQAFSSPAIFAFQYQNLEKVRFQGIEVEAKYSSNSYLFSAAISTLKANETRNNNSILQTPSKKLIIKAQKKFENGLSFGFENISASSVGKSDFIKYGNYTNMQSQYVDNGIRKFKTVEVENKMNVKLLSLLRLVTCFINILLNSLSGTSISSLSESESSKNL